MKAILRSGFLALVIMALAVPAYAGPLEDGVAARQRGDYATAIRIWRPLAEQGHARAQSNLGFMYSNGEGVPQDYAEAVKWYRMAAEQGNGGAQFNLGVMYGRGVFAPPTGSFSLGVSQDIVQEYMWFSLAAAQGFEAAQKGLDIAARSMTPDQIA